MDKRIFRSKWIWTLGIIGTLAAASAVNGESIILSTSPKTIVITNLDTATFTKGDPAMAAVAQSVCGDCHSSDYPTTQPKLNCAGWGKAIVKMGTTFGAVTPWNQTFLKRDTLKQILSYLTDNYGSGGSAACTGHELDSIPLNQ